ncbi:MAG: hypothetical protein CL607_22890 [Anaerolineaceae bacterium]|nr:hypothetical protein [Anaerolineaceae bacterium]
MKKVLLFIVDALAARVVEQAMDRGKLPHLDALRQRGVFRNECISILPSITPAALSSLATGRYPQDHRIMGAHWYKTQNDEVEYFGGDFWVLMNKGVGEFFQEFLGKLNHDLLKADTIFDILEEQGIATACLNFFIYHGPKPHEVNVPLMLGLMPGVHYDKEVYGSSILYLGDFVKTPLADGHILDGSRNVTNRYGFNDETTFDMLYDLKEHDAFPPFTLAYCPDNDFESHEKGPHVALHTLEAFDERLGNLFELFGGVDAMLDEFAIVIAGDHAQISMTPGEDKDIKLDAVLDGIQIVNAGETWDDDDSIIITPNLRKAQIHLKQPTLARRDQVVGKLLADARVDQVMWRVHDFDESKYGFYIKTADRGQIHFWADDEGTACDAQGQYWRWDGDLSAVDAQVEGDRLIFRDYPNIFERVACALNVIDSGHIWVLAHPGYEITLPRTDVHEGGSHGSLHRSDSETVLFVAGAPDDLAIPEQPRSVDVAPICLDILGVTSPLKTGVSHIREQD